MILLLLLLLHYLWAKDVLPPDITYHIQQINSCPVEGYYFKRQLEPNSLGPGRCHLCFCQENGIAVCWLRNNRRCNVESYHHHKHNVGKRDIRQRRSPLGLGELFFKDAAKEVFNKQTPEVCKPFESSFSEGCPPEDWCIGCTVCDCNANGRWDCRVLSFCGDDKVKKQIKKRNSKPKAIKPNQKNISKSTNKKIFKKSVVNQTSSKPPTSAIVKRAPTPTTAPSRNKNTIQKRKTSPKPLILKKDIQTRKPLTLSARKKANDVTQRPVSDQFTQEVVKKVVTAMQKLLIQQVTATIPEIVKIVQKKTMELNNLNNKTQKNKVSNVTKRKVSAINKKQYYRTVAVSKPAKNNKATKVYIGSTVPTKSTGTSQTGTTMYGNPRTVANKKANTKLMKSYRHKRHTFLDNELTTEMVRSSQLGRFSNNTPSANGELTESVMFNNSAIDGNYNYSEALTTPIYYDTTDNNSFIKYSTDNTEVITNEPQSVNYSDVTLSVTEGLLNNTTFKTQMYNDTKKILLDKISNANELKYMEWSQMKTFKEKEKEYRSQSNNTTSLLSSDNDYMNYSTVLNLPTEAKVKIHRYNVKRKLDIVPKRFNVTRVVSTIACHLKNEDRSHSVNSNNGRISKKNDNLEGILKNLFQESGISNTTKSKTRRKLNVVKYLRIFFRKLFYKSKIKPVDADIMDNKRTIDTLCASFGPCLINKENKVLVRRKFKELNNETHLMMKSINIIKGLLRLLDFPLTENHFSESKDRSDFKDDIQKLTIILKTQHSDNDQANKLSETQLTQIAYIKNNTRLIIQSIVRFVNILNDVIDILTLKNRHHAQEKSNYVKNIRINSTKPELLTMLKQLLGKYNIIQNTFIMKMHEILSKIHVSSNGLTNGNESSTNTNKASDSRATDRFTNTIFRNIRKLKNLAEVLSTRGRKKRQTEGSDAALEYLLMIMEYLMKKNQPVNVAPANDGIDLLIQAIQNAPDIKPVAKQVRVYPPLKKITITVGKKAFQDKLDDSFSDSKISKENIFTSKANDNKSIARDQSMDDDTYFNSIKFNKGVVNEDSTPSFLEKNNSTGKKKQTIFSSDHILEKNPSIPFKLQILNKQSNEITDRNHLDREDNFLDAGSVTDGGGVNRKFEVFVADYDDDTENEELFNMTTYGPEPLTKQSVSTISSHLTDDFKLNDMKLRQFNDDIITNDNVKFITKPILQWVDTDEEEDKSHLDKFLTDTITKPVTEALTQSVTSKKPSKKSHEDISDFSKELDDEDKKKLSKVNTDEVMFKKQVDFLNSLDYGTERPDDSDSKDARYPINHYDIL